MYPLNTSINTELEVLANVTTLKKKKKKKGNTGLQIGKEEVKLSLYTDDMTVYIGNPKVPKNCD